MAKGIDYAWHGTINWSCLVNSGVHFIARYFSYDSSKDLTKSELDGAMANGIEVAVVWETTANRMLSGYNGGKADAQESKNRANNLGIGTIPIYFACDWDASESQQPTINSYLDGCISVLGKARVGMYAGYHPLKRAFDAGKITYGWQTYAWSGGMQDSRMHLYQYHNGVTVCGLSADWDESKKDDFAQWPRPGGNVIPPTPTPTEWSDFMSASAMDSGGNLHFVAIWDQPEHRVNYKPPNGSWVAVDTGSRARSGASIFIDNEDMIFITYTNTEGQVCTYRKPCNGGKWQWDEYGPSGGKVM